MIAGVLLVLIYKSKCIENKSTEMDKEQSWFWIYLTFLGLRTKLLLYFVLFLEIFN